MNKVAILGPGLLGGSIALALRQRFPSLTVAAWARRAEIIEEIRGAVSLASTNVKQVVADADLVILCVPVGSMPGIAAAIAPYIAPHTLVTDVGSVKAPVVAALKPMFNGRFLGSHPMAGSERTGFCAARADLFEGAVCILTPEADTDATALETLSRFWQSIGCQTRSLSPQVHDQTVALVSHLPHLLAAALVGLVQDCDPEAFAFCGPGFRDTTRVASGAPEMWTGIFASNSNALKTSAEAMIEKLQQIVTLIDRPEEMRSFLGKSKAARDKIRITQ